MKMISSQTAEPCIRICGLEIQGACQPRYIPAVTAASTPDNPSCSAGKYAA